MNTPALLLGAAIVFWGWQTDHLVLGVLLAAAIEAARIVPMRLAVTPAQLVRVNDFCLALAAVAGGYFYATQGNPKAITLFFLWLPVAFAPLGLAQAFGSDVRFELATMLWGLRRESRRRLVHFNFGYLYLAAWIVGAAAANRRDAGFDAGLCILAAWTLWSIRPATGAGVARAGLWTAILAVAIAIGFAGHTGLRNLQVWLEGNIPEWLAGEPTEPNPFRADTAIGRIGELKQSEQIVLRVKLEGVPGGPLAEPLLLHRASFDAYSSARWKTGNATFVRLASVGVGAWQLVPGVEPGAAARRATIVLDSKTANPLLVLPRGTRRIEGLSAVELKRGANGSVQAEVPPGFVRYHALFGAEESLSAAPGPEDLAVPRAEGEALGRIARGEGLVGSAPEAALKAVRRYFARDFRYSLFQAAPEGNSQGPAQGPALIRFLTTTRSGHCEYFATATVLLLRAAGVPARYVSGYSVSEWSAREGAWIARARHSHAWARAWIGDRWVDVDTTPSDWSMAEGDQAPWYSVFGDYWSWLRHALFQWREGGEGLPWPVIVVALVIGSWLGWRALRKTVRSGAKPSSAAPSAPAPGAGDFQRLEEWVARAGWPRQSTETVREWVRRLEVQKAPVPGLAALADLSLQQTRRRFDPRGLDASASDRFHRAISEWIARAAL